MKLDVLIVCNQATPIDYVINPKFIAYFQDLDSKKKLVNLEKYYSLIGLGKESELLSILEQWRSENRVMTYQQLQKFNDYLKDLRIDESLVKTLENYNESFSKEFYEDLEKHIANSFPMPSSGISIFFRDMYKIELKNAIYLDNYGNFCISFNNRKISNNLELSSIAIYEESNEKKIVIPKIDSTEIILSVFEEKMKNHNINLINPGRIFNQPEMKILIEELMLTELDFQGYGLKKVGLYGHVHKKASGNIKKLSNQDIDDFDLSQLEELVSSEEHFYNGKIFEIVSDDFVKYLNKSDLDFFMQQIRVLHDSLFQGTDKSYRSPERTFVLHFINQGKDYAIVEKSKLITFKDDNVVEEIHNNRFGAICFLDQSGKSLNSVVKFCEDKLSEMQEKAYKKEVTRALF